MFFWSILIESLASYLMLFKSTDLLISSSLDNESWDAKFSWEYEKFNPKKIKIIKKIKYFFSRFKIELSTRYLTYSKLIIILIITIYENEFP